jgi:hypothetical protein
MLKALKAVKDSADSGSVALLMLMVVVFSALGFASQLESGDAAAKGVTHAAHAGGKTS